MPAHVDIDVETLKSEIKKTYAQVSTQPEKDFVFPTGRAWAEDLDYPDELARVPETAVESYAGVANPFSLGRLSPGERVLDLGCGAGTDTLVAAQMVAPEGHVTGIDMTPGDARQSARRGGRDERSERQLLDVSFDELDVGSLCTASKPTYGASRKKTGSRRASAPGARPPQESSREPVKRQTMTMLACRGRDRDYRRDPGRVEIALIGFGIDSAIEGVTHPGKRDP